MISPRAVLIGPPGSGKSTVATRLADLWNVASRDTDTDIVKADGREVAEIFVESGESEFRRIEREIVRDALASHTGVLALGGGAILDSETQAELRDYAARGGVIVFLNVREATAARRVGLARSRPLLAGSPREAWRRLMEERRGVYESLATMIVDADRLSPRDVATRIADTVGPSTSGGGVW